MKSFTKAVGIPILLLWACFYIGPIEMLTNCLYCLRADTDATFLITYWYCKATDSCTQDEYLYIDDPCSSKWERGKKVSFSSCSPTLTTCHSFTSTSAAAGTWYNYTETLGLGEYCVI